MACAKPVIASGVGQVATVLDDGRDGLLTSNDLNDIYDKILFCLENRQKAEEIGKAAREKIVNTYNWGQTAKSTLELFKSLQHT
jgi:glycosyltransferase involved in cell wall biosynthesis